MRIHVAGATAAGEVKEFELEVPEGTTAGEATATASERFGLKKAEGADALAIWGRHVEGNQSLRDGDRVEITEPLKIDPNEARRLRAERAAGKHVFSQGRHGGKHRLF